MWFLKVCVWWGVWLLGRQVGRSEDKLLVWMFSYSIGPRHETQINLSNKHLSPLSHLSDLVLCFETEFAV